MTNENNKECLNNEKNMYSIMCYKLAKDSSKNNWFNKPQNLSAAIHKQLCRLHNKSFLEGEGQNYNDIIYYVGK